MLHPSDTSRPHETRQAEDRLLCPIPEAAHLLGVGRSSIYALLDAGALASVNIGRRRLVTRASIDALIASRLVGGAK